MGIAAGVPVSYPISSGDLLCKSAVPAVNLVAWFDFPTGASYANSVNAAQTIGSVSGLQTTTQQLNATLGSHHSETFPTSGSAAGHQFNYSTNPINVTNSFSVCFWLRQNSAMSLSAPSDFTGIIGIDIDQLQIAASANGDVVVIDNGVNRAYANIDSINTWNFFVITYTNTSSNNYTVSIYINGSTTPYVTSASFTRSWSTNAIRSLGGYVRSSTHVTPITLKIDSLGVYNKVLSASDITYLYNAGTGRTYADTLK